jgi:hypothetical protein
MFLLLWLTPTAVAVAAEMVETVVVGSGAVASRRLCMANIGTRIPIFADSYRLVLLVEKLVGEFSNRA